VVVSGDEWSSVEVPDLVVHPLNLVLYIHLRMFVYSSNFVMSSFERMDSMLTCVTSGTWKNSS
jgi:hypothetical protein